MKCTYCNVTVPRRGKGKICPSCYRTINRMETALVTSKENPWQVLEHSTITGRISSAVPNLMNVPRDRWNKMSRAEQKNLNFAAAYGASEEKIRSLLHGNSSASGVIPITMNNHNLQITKEITLPNDVVSNVDYSEIERRWQEAVSTIDTATSSRSSPTSSRKTRSGRT